MIGLALNIWAGILGAVGVAVPPAGGGTTYYTTYLSMGQY